MNNVLKQQQIYFYKMSQTGGQLDLGSRSRINGYDIIRSCFMFFFWSFFTAIIVIYHFPLELMLLFLAFAVIRVLTYCTEKCCVKKNALDTQTGTRNGTRTGTGNRTETGNGTTGNIEEFVLYDSNRSSMLERSNLPSSTHTSTNNYAVPTISRLEVPPSWYLYSRPTLDNLSLQGQTSLQRASLDLESRVADTNRLPIYLSDTLSEPTNSVGANVPSAPPLEEALSLPSYNEVINQSNYEVEEEPPPTYDEVILKINSNL